MHTKVTLSLAPGTTRVARSVNEKGLVLSFVSYLICSFMPNPSWGLCSETDENKKSEVETTAAAASLLVWSFSTGLRTVPSLGWQQGEGAQKKFTQYFEGVYLYASLRSQISMKYSIFRDQ